MAREGTRRGPWYQNTTQPHPTEQQPTDISKAEPNSPTNCTTQAHNIVSKNREHNKNHTQPQHPQQYISYLMQPTMQHEEDGLRERHTNIALQVSACRRDHSPISSSEIIWNDRSLNKRKNQIRTSRGVQPSTQRSLASLTLPHRHWGRKGPHRLLGSRRSASGSIPPRRRGYNSHEAHLPPQHRAGQPTQI